MKKFLVPLLVLALLFISAAAPAEENEAITLEINTAKLPVYAADDPYPASLGLAAQPEESGLPVLVLPAKKSLQLQVTVLPKTLKNRKYTLSVENEDVAKVRTNSVSGLQPGETVLTVASAQDPTVTSRFRLLVIRQVTRIAVTASEKSVAVGQTITLTPAFTPEDATLKEVEWSSANEQIATVDGNGNVTGLKRGTARITAAAKDGSKIRANISVQVTQGAEEITLDKPELTVDTGKTAVLKATVLPRDTNDKGVLWTSSDESIAKVNNQGRITGVALGDCEITCTSKSTGTVKATAVVHVQQPVKKVSFGEAPVVYTGETARLTWITEPANASNPALTFKSSNEKILTVSEDGTVTGIKAGEATVTARTRDGSNRQARIKVRVYQHVTGVHMKRRTAYIDVRATSTAGAILEPENATNHNMTWESADTSVATAVPMAKQKNRVNVTGVARGETTVTGTTEDGGFQTSILVKVGDWEHALKLTDAYVEGDLARPTVKNVSDLTITSITIEVSIYDIDGQPVPCNSKDSKSNTFQMVYRNTLSPGATTKQNGWKVVRYKQPTSLTVSDYVLKITEFEIDHDWIKVIRKKNQPTKKCPVHL